MRDILSKKSSYLQSMISYEIPPDSTDQLVTKSQVKLIDILNPDSREIIIMPEQTLVKHIEDILQKKFEVDEKMAL